jgi:hypothetical protein
MSVIAPRVEIALGAVARDPQAMAHRAHEIDARRTR